MSASNIIRSSDEDSDDFVRKDPLETLVNQMTSKKKNFSTIFALGNMNRILTKFTHTNNLSSFDKKLITNFFRDAKQS